MHIDTKAKSMQLLGFHRLQARCCMPDAACQMLHAVCVYACSLSVKQNIYKELLNQYYKLLCPACPNNFMPGSVVMTAYNLLHARFTEPAWLVRLLPEELFGVEPSPASNDCS